MKHFFIVVAAILMLTAAMPASGQEIYPFPLLHETSEIWGYAYNYDRKKQVIGYMFEAADQFNHETGLARVKFDGFVGAIDVGGNFVIEPVYDDIIYQPYSKTYVVLLNGKYGELNMHGELLKQIQYDELSAQPKRGWYEYKIGEVYYYLAPDGHVTTDWSEYLNAPSQDW